MLGALLRRELRKRFGVPYSQDMAPAFFGPMLEIMLARMFDVVSGILRDCFGEHSGQGSRKC